jgi:hypothetical protein
MVKNTKNNMMVDPVTLFLDNVYDIVIVSKMLIAVPTTVINTVLVNT